MDSSLKNTVLNFHLVIVLAQHFFANLIDFQWSQVLYVICFIDLLFITLVQLCERHWQQLHLHWRHLIPNVHSCVVEQLYFTRWVQITCQTFFDHSCNWHFTIVFNVKDCFFVNELIIDFDFYEILLLWIFFLYRNSREKIKNLSFYGVN